MIFAFIIQNKMFEKAWRITSTQNNSLIGVIKRLKQLQEELKNDRSAKSSQYFQAILKEVLGGGNEAGILAQLSKQIQKYKVVEWLQLVEEVIAIIGPESLLMQKILINPQLKITINTGLLPPTFNLKKHNEQKRIIEIKQAYQGYSVSLLDGYFIMLINGILTHTQSGVEYSQNKKLLLDDFFGRISKNPFLVLLRRLFIFFANNRIYVRKLAEIIRMFFVEEIVSKYEGDHRIKAGYKDEWLDSTNNSSKISSFGERSSRRSPLLHYRLKENHLLCLYLFLRYASQHCFDFKRYMLGVCENYSALASDRQCLHTFVRVWMFWVGTQNYHHIENQVIDALDNSNCNSGWFQLERYSARQISSQQTNNFETVEQVFKLFAQQKNWEINCSYIYTITLFFKFLHVHEYFCTSSENHSKDFSICGFRQDTREENCVKNMMDHINRKLVDIVWQCKQKIVKKSEFQEFCALLYGNLGVMESYYRDLWENKMKARNKKFESDRTFKFKKVTDADIARNQIIQEMIPGSVETIDKNNLVSFYRRQQKPAWQVPIQYHQSTVLFYFFYAIAKGIDKTFPGKRQQPLPCLRSLSSPLNFFLLLLVIFIMYTLFI